MRIAYLHQYFVTPDMAGGSRSYEMARRLVMAGHEVHVVTADPARDGRGEGWRTTDESGIHVHWTSVPYDNSFSYGDRIRAFFRFAWRSAHRAADVKPDLVFATSTPLTIALPAVYAKWRARCPMVFEVRDLWPEVPIAIGALRHPLAKWGARRLEKFAYTNAAHVVALAPGMRDSIVATGYPADRVSVIPNGCDLDVFSPGRGEALRAATPWLGERPMLLFTGTFGRVNGMDYLARLAAEAARLDPDVRIVGIGAGAELEPTRELGRSLGVLDRSLFLLGQRPKKEVAAWLQATDMTLALFTGPEVVWRDAVQNKFFDSLSAGKPVANNFRGWQALVAEEAGAGIILDPRDVPGAARHVVDSLRNREWLASAGGAARRLAEQRFDRNLLGAQLARLLEKVGGA